MFSKTFNYFSRLTQAEKIMLSLAAGGFFGAQMANLQGRKWQRAIDSAVERSIKEREREQQYEKQIEESRRVIKEYQQLEAESEAFFKDILASRLEEETSNKPKITEEKNHFPRIKPH
jgi:hypothetical protein